MSSNGSCTYPGILDPDELVWPGGEPAALAGSLAAYRAGDLLAALEQYPAGRAPASNAERVYLAALLLTVGQVEPAENLLEPAANGQSGEVGSQRTAWLAVALRKVIAAVKRRPFPSNLSAQPSTPTATELLAESYYQQAQARLEPALEAARQAVARAPRFGFAQARLAELEFSFGHTKAARKAVERSLELSPRNAQAFALKGFLLAAENRYGEAIAAFDRAIALNGALGNAWLGRGLCRIHRGDGAGGLADLQTAVTLEPQRSVLRSYLGKAFDQQGLDAQTAKELRRGQELDPADPTAWLYSALLNQEHNRINQAVRDLEHSQELVGNRGVYRSQLLLDQDRAVRGANLASVYRDAGMTDVSLREAARAVNYDYANYSAHLFLANSYNALRDPRQINLRYETPWLSEYLVGNLLAPVGAGALSQTVSQNEYGRLFERNRLGVVSATEYLSRGDWTQSGAQFGTWGNSEYALEAFYQSRNGQRVNNDLEQLTLGLQFKAATDPAGYALFPGDLLRCRRRAFDPGL